MTSLITKFHSALEDSNYPLIGRNVKLLKMSYLLPEQAEYRPAVRVKAGILLSFMVFFALTQATDTFINILNIVKFLRNMKYVLMSTMIIAKVSSYMLWQNRWESIIQFVNEVTVDRLKTDDQISIKINKKIVKYCKIIIYIYIYLTSATVFLVLIQPILIYCLRMYSSLEDDLDKYIPITNTWVPFDKDNPIVYLFSMLLQIYATIYSLIYIVAFDANAVSTMVFFRGELELLRRDSQILFGTSNLVNEETARVNLSKCQKRHQDLVK